MLFAIIGAVSGAAIDLGNQWIGGGNIDWNSVSASAFTGALFGAFGGSANQWIGLYKSSGIGMVCAEALAQAALYVGVWNGYKSSLDGVSNWADKMLSGKIGLLNNSIW